MKKMQYGDLFGDDIGKQMEVAKVLKEQFKKRKDMLKREEISSVEEEPSEPVLLTSVLQQFTTNWI